MSFGVLDGDGQVAQIEGHPFGRISFTGARFAQADIRLLSPILPSKVVCVGKNYAAHIEEMKGTGDAPKEPLLFLKPSTSVIGPGDAIRIPPGSTNVHHEAELAVVIGARGARNVTPEQAGQRLRLHDRQRRHRAGHAEERRAVDPRQGLRLLLPDRARGSRPTCPAWASTRPTSRSPAPSTASRASRAAPAS